MLFADSIYIAEKTPEYRRVVLGNIGVTYLYQSDYQKAIEYFNLSLGYIKKGQINEDLLLMRGNVAEALYYQKKTKEAESLFLELYPEAKKET